MMNDLSTLNHHQSHPETSLDAHRKHKHLELSDWILKRKIVYLDTKFWLILRDAYLNRPKETKDRDLLELAVQLVEKDVCIFPISQHVFSEVIKQTDEKTRTATADLIDILSKGISVLSFDEQFRLEVLCYLDEKRGKDIHQASELIWTKVSYVLGFQYPSGTPFDQQTELAIQKAFLDHMWTISLVQMLDTIEENGGIAGFGALPDTSANLNEGKFAHQNDHNSFKKMFLAELDGTLEAFEEMINNLMVYIYERDTGEKATADTLRQAQANKTITTMIYDLFKNNKINTGFPALRIQAGLYAAVRWDKKQKFQTNDIYDFGHATAALPYCDLFFTEKRLHHLLTQKQLSFDKLYNCTIASKTADSLSALRALSV